MSSESQRLGTSTEFSIASNEAHAIQVNIPVRSRNCFKILYYVVYIILLVTPLLTMPTVSLEAEKQIPTDATRTQVWEDRKKSLLPIVKGTRAAK
jgi:energy-converting hydrogenase Eha subunit H